MARLTGDGPDVVGHGYGNVPSSVPTTSVLALVELGGVTPDDALLLDRLPTSEGVDEAVDLERRLRGEPAVA